jgi:hypothetical protein
MRYGMNEYEMPSQHRQKPLQKEDAEKILKIYLDMSRNPNLKTGRSKKRIQRLKRRLSQKKTNPLLI